MNNCTEIRELASSLGELADSKGNVEKCKLWADLFDLKPSRPVVNMYFYQYVWAKEEGLGLVKSEEPLAKLLEEQIRYRLWRGETFDDDVPASKCLRIPWDAVISSFPEKEDLTNNIWGLEIELEKSSSDGSYRVKPPIKDESDLEKIGSPVFEFDSGLCSETLGRAREIVGDLVDVKIQFEQLHWGPFEYAVWLRGMDNLIFDFYDKPDFVHKLMDLITKGMIKYQLDREKAGCVDAEMSFFGHVPYDKVNQEKENRLKSCWAYVHAQSSGIISPDMYAEFVHPYNVKIAELVGRVYYHGCEDLSKKCGTIKDLPNLRLFHISPWTEVEPVVSELGKGFAYEVHSHPTNVLYTYSNEQIRDELKHRNEPASDFAHTIVLADVETAGENLEKLKYWVACAKEIAHS